MSLWTRLLGWRHCRLEKFATILVTPPKIGEGEFCKRYLFNAEVQSVSGMLKHKVLGIKLAGSVFVRGAQTLLTDQVYGESVWFSGHVVQMRNKKGVDITGQIPEDKRVLDSVSVVLQPVLPQENGAGAVFAHQEETEEYYLKVEGVVSADWSTIADIAITGGLKGARRFLLKEVTVTGTSSLASTWEKES